MYIRNKKFSSISDINNISNHSDIPSIPDISEISEIKPKSEAKTIETITVDIRDRTNKNDKSNINDISDKTKSSNRTVEYLSKRKYYILAMSFVYVVGVVIGSLLINNIDKKDTSGLCASIDGYFTGISSVNMTARILGNMTLNMVFMFGIYLCGIIVFSHIVCSAFCLYKGLTCGFIIGVYTVGGGTNFHLAVCGIYFMLYLLIMMFFILTCAESMSFSSFLFRNEDSFRNCLSFKNISVYSSRHLLFLALVALSTAAQTLIIPVVYALAG